jgi:hypothetical protein
MVTDVPWLDVDTYIVTLTSINTVAIAGIGLILLISYYIKHNRGAPLSTKIRYGKVLAELNKQYVENPDFIRLYDCLQDCLEGKCVYNKTGICPDGVPCKLPIPRDVVSNYLTFFERIYLLEKDGVISFKTLDDLFAYRFFLIVHSKFVQQNQLGFNPSNFKKIFCLEKKWLEYRKHRNKKKMAVCERLLLKDLIDDDMIYGILTKE